MKRWVKSAPQSQEAVQNLSQLIGTPVPISTILLNRGITNFQQAKLFFRPALDHLYDPFLMQDMDRAVERLEQALWKNPEQILVYGDYDVDGTTAVAMVYDFFTTTSNGFIRYYIPNRIQEGYGLSMLAVTKAAEEGVKLIVTLDCGIKDVQSITKARALGIDVIVCDHHEVGEDLPPAYAILDPKQSNCNYPFKSLSGCGVGFKLIQAITIKRGIPWSRIEPYLGLVAISTACDLVPLVDENRILVYHGIHQLERTPALGLQMLFVYSHVGTGITINDLVFKIGPRINAAGRMDDAQLAVQLLLAKDPEQAKELASIIQGQNQLRKTLDQTTTEEALALITTQEQAKKTTVLFAPNWHKGVIGIVASRCIEHHYRPTIILTESNGKAVGSARSVYGYNIYQAIDGCSKLLEQYGGHAFAAGLTLSIERIPDFAEKFEKLVAQTIPDHLLMARQPIDSALDFDAITPKLVNVLMQMAPFGSGNPTPVFSSDRVSAQNYRLIKNRHLKLVLCQQGCPTAYSAIAFDLPKALPMLEKGQLFSIAYTLGYNNYFGDRSIELTIKDIRPPE